MITTTVCRVDLTAAPDLQAALEDVCQGQAIAGSRLAASFVHGNQLVLIFQGQDEE